MGRQAFPIVGGIIGAVVAAFATDGTATWQGYEAGFAIGAAIGGIAGSYIDPILIQGNTIGDTDIQVAAEGGARAMLYGRACVSATCVIARGNRQVHNNKSSNGKGSSGSTENQTVTWTFAIGLGEDLVGASVCRIWQDNNLVYDVTGAGAISNDDNARFAGKFKFYDGSETQLPDPDLQAFLGAQTPYFRGTGYVVFPNFDLTTTAERIPQFKFEVLQGIAGVVDDLETLSWSLPHAGVGVSSQSVTLTANPGLLLNINMFLTGDMEVRRYNDPSIEYVGGLGPDDTPVRFIKANGPGAAAGWETYNIYQIEVSEPHQLFYVNQALPSEVQGNFIRPDGSSRWKLNFSAAGNATITFYATDVEGASAYYPQFGTVRAELTGVTTGGTGSIKLDGVVRDVLLKAGMTEDQFDVSALDDYIAGVCIQNTASGAAAVGAIVAPFFADPTEKDGKLVWIKRGQPVVRTLTIDDLTEEPDVASRENTIEYPAKLHFFYESPTTGYASTKATSYRYSPQADSSGEGSVTSPVTFFNSDEPAQIAQKLHKVAWTEAQGSFTWKVGMQCIDLLPGDAVGLYLRGISTRARITAIESDGNTLTLTMLKDRQSSYTSAVTGIPLPIPTPPLPTTMSPAVLAVLDIPALQDTDDALVYYTGMSGSTSVWKGGELSRSLDAGATWSVLGQVTTETTMGHLAATMTAASALYTDTTNTVMVQLFDSSNELTSWSDTTFNQEQGAIAVQSPDGLWEVMQYRDAVQQTVDTWALTTLKRGRLNTTPAAHAVGALFVVLDKYLVKNTGDIAWLTATLKHRAVSFGTNTEDAAIVSTTYHGNSQLEWSPASATVEYDGATVVAVTDIVPRYRFGTEVTPLDSLNHTGYRVAVTTSAGTTTVDITSGTALVTVSSAPTSVTVAAINRITGPGQSLTITSYTLVATGSLH